MCMEYQPLFTMKISIRYLPLIIPVTLLVLVIFTSFLAFHYGHVSTVAPYISDTGTIPPESCYFGQVLNIISIQIAFAMYCKFRQVKDILQKHNMTHKDNLNKYTFIVGLIAAFGISIVANFQETSSLVIHWIGAVMCFGFGSLYLCLQTSLYIVITPIIGQMMLTKVRIVLSGVALTSFVIFFVCGMISYTRFTGTSHIHWKQEDGGFEWHLSSTITEWLCAISLMIYISLFGEEFRDFVIYEPSIDSGLGKLTSHSKRDSKNSGGSNKARGQKRRKQ